ncbi:glycosyltransferase family 4 protein [Prosthecobacter vanneervenii]|uniref:Glycosyltransferase involved in cell wall biosynthesis n=1 Tax=Prosthecobacter vanneervenii TaxID=48466 RepID=A0A7W8DJL4_9BACT|nr:glycosyltransferase family 4 protein [Prosthecobacter vanneervenii]MBB5032207.1 glycosyltransferase involved in cell wall biosynthesis [Prosthecobacter vanneervenii]
MKILYVHERFGALAGAEANAFITAQELGARGHYIGILHGPGTGKNEDGWKQAFRERYPITEDAAAQTYAALQSFRPDAVYVHKMANLEVIQTLVESGVPLIRMVHDHDIYCMRSYKYHYFSRKICTRAASLYCVYGCGACLVKNSGGAFPLKWVSYRSKKKEIALNRRFHRMIVVTQYMRDELLRNSFDAGKIEIHAPVPRMGDPDLRSSFSDRNLILYAGQIIRGKGVDVLLESLARVKSKFECIILGDGNHKAYCEELCRKLGLQHKVQFKGFIPQEELKAYYRECSVVALSSVWPEPIATIGLEVMRYALPVVAFDAGGIKDWLKDGFNGHLVPWMNRDAFASSLDSLLQNKEQARKLGENGLRLVSTRYDFPSYIAGLEEMFGRAIAEAEQNCARQIPPLEGGYSLKSTIKVSA